MSPTLSTGSLPTNYTHCGVSLDVSSGQTGTTPFVNDGSSRLIVLCPKETEVDIPSPLGKLIGMSPDMFELKDSTGKHHRIQGQGRYKVVDPGNGALEIEFISSCSV
jgi:hypothetical protein